MVNRRRVSLIFFLATPFGNLSALGVEPANRASRDVSEWLRELDAANYEQTWATASQVFKVAVSAEAWSQAAQLARAQLGQLRKRTQRSASFTRTLPGVADGEYVVLKFNSVFAKKSHAIETVTARRELDGKWRVAGYFIQ